MDYPRAGRTIRALRIRADLLQDDVALLIERSRTQVGRMERGEMERMPIGDIDAAVKALGAELDLRIRWHGEGLDRLLDSTHATLVERVLELLKPLGWECAVEVSFSV